MVHKSLFIIVICLVFQIQLNSQNLTSTGNRSAGSEYLITQSEVTSHLKSGNAAMAITDSISLVSDASKLSHNLTGSNMNQGISNGRSWVNADKGWFSFELKPDSVISNEIKCTFWGGDAGKSAFDIYVENVKIATQRLKATSPGNFISIAYAVPHALTRHKATVTVKFQSKTDSIAGPLYGCFIQTTAAASATWPLNIHDPSSIIKCGNTYYVYGTGDGIFTASSTDLVKWKSEPTPFAKWGFPSYITTFAPKFEGTFWAPECIYMNGKYYLYYSASEWGTKNSCIGVAVSNSLNPSDPAYKWTDLGLVVGSSGGSNYNAIDPAVMRDPTTGKIWLTYGSFNIAGIKVAELDSVTGKMKNAANQVSICNHYVGGNSYIGEASFMIYHSGYYYLFVNYGGCCAGVNSTYYIITGRSASPTGPFVDKNGSNLYQVGTTSGGTIVLKHDDSRGYDDRFYGPGCLGYFVDNGTEYVNFHYYDPNFPYPGQPAGGPMMAIAKLKWSEDGWPQISFDFLEKGRYKVYNKNSGLYWDKNNTAMIQATTSSAQSQLWDLYPLGTGEYKISNSSATANFVETSGADRNGVLQLNAFENAIYEKFRVLKSKNNELLFYQSAGLRVMEVPFASLSSGAQLGVWWFNDNNCQKWYATRVGDVPESAKNLIADKSFRVFPNPVKDVINIKDIKRGTLVELVDINGKVVAKDIAQKEMWKINTVNLLKGIYLLRITENGITNTLKIVKE